MRYLGLEIFPDYLFLKDLHFYFSFILTFNFIKGIGSNCIKYNIPISVKIFKI